MDCQIDIIVGNSQYRNAVASGPRYSQGLHRKQTRRVTVLTVSHYEAIQRNN